jgi:ABC-2 type transport system permease protein
MSAVDYKKYFIAVYCVRQFSAVWMIYMFEWEMIEGRLSNHLLKPLQPLWYHVAAHLGEQLARFPFFILILGLFMWINPDVLFSGWDWRMILLGIVAIYAALALRFAVQFCFAMICFWFERSASIESLSFLPYFFLSGMAVPMGDIPQPLRDFLMWTPFPYMISYPARILTGVADAKEIIFGALVMSAWFLFFVLLGGILWKRGLRKYSGQGA